MKRLCFGSYIKVLTLCKSAAGKSQKNICGTVILSVNPKSYDLRTDDGTTSDLVLCRKNLTQSIVDSAKEIDAQTNKSPLCEFFKVNVLCLIDDNKKSDIVLTLKDIIANDTHIKPDTVIDKVSGLTKTALGTTDTFIIEDFLAGIFLYTATVVANTEGGSSVKAIDKNYISQFAGRENEVRFVDKINYANNADANAQSELSTDNELKTTLQGKNAPRKLGESDLVDLFEEAIDKYGIANFVDTDFTAMPLMMDWVGDVDDFVQYLRASVFPRFRHISREAIYGYCVEFVNVIDAYNGYMGIRMRVTDDCERAIWLPGAGYEINEETLNYRRELNRLYGLISDGGTLSVYGYTRTENDKPAEDTHTYGDNHKKNTSEDTSGQTVNNTALVFQQFGTDNKQIVGNIETLIINNKGG